MSARVCSIDGCERAAAVKGMCDMHDQRRRKTGSAGEASPRRMPTDGACSVDGCERVVKCKGMCGMHYQRVKKAGNPGGTEPLMRYYDPVCSIDGCEKPHTGKGYCGMHLARIQKDGHHGPVEPKINPSGDGYVSVHGYRVVRYNGRAVHQHRVVMAEALGRDLYDHENVHHINGDRLDNRLENLELWSTSQPAGQRIEDKVTWAREFLAQYGYEVAQ